MTNSDQLSEIRNLIEANGYLPYSNKALRLFALAENTPQIDAAEVGKLKAMFQEAGYLPFSRALELLDMVAEFH